MMGGSRERGSVSVEVAVLTPALVVMVVLLIVAGRVQLAGGAVENAAAAAARAASLQRSPAAARRVADDVARQTLAEQHLDCQLTTVRLDTSGYAVPAGQAATVQVEVSCVVRLADVGLPGMPGAKTMRYTATSPLDPYRARVLGFVISDRSPAARLDAGGAR